MEEASMGSQWNVAKKISAQDESEKHLTFKPQEIMVLLTEPGEGSDCVGKIKFSFDRVGFDIIYRQTVSAENVVDICSEMQIEEIR